MRDRHFYSQDDSALKKRIFDEVAEKRNPDSSFFYRMVWLKFGFYFSLIILFYSLLLTLESSMFFVLTYIGYGIIFVLFTLNFAHDLSHNTVFKSKKINNIAFTSIFTLVGAHAEAWRQRHINSHHYAPNVANYDSDLNITDLIRLIPNSTYLWYHKYQYLYAPFAYSSYSLFWIFIKDFVNLYSKDEYNTNKSFAYHISFWIQKTIYLLMSFVIPLLFSSQSIGIVAIGFFLMHLTQSVFLLFTFIMTHHVLGTKYPTTDESGLIKTSWLMNQIKSSNDMHPFSKSANFILGGFNNHITHHLFPHIHHVYYPEIDKIIYRILRENNIEPNHTTYWGGIISHLKLLKKMSVNPRNESHNSNINHEHRIA